MSEEWYKFYSVEDPSVYTYLHGTLGEAIDLCELRNITKYWGDNFRIKVCIVTDLDVMKDRTSVFNDKYFWNIGRRLKKEAQRFKQEREDDV